MKELNKANINILPAATSKSLNDMREHQYQHTPHSNIKQIYEYIKNGDVERIRNSISIFAETPVNVGRMSSNNLTQAKYTAAATASTAVYIGIENGLPDEYGYSFADIFIQEIDKMNDEEGIYAKIQKFLIQFTELMYSLKCKTQNPYVLKCIHYIHVHLNHKITVEDLVNTCHLSRSRLSALFKTEIGETIIEYIQHERLKESRYMLTSGHYNSINEIALFLNFCSQSYYTECFKKYYSISPSSLFQRKH